MIANPALELQVTSAFLGTARRFDCLLGRFEPISLSEVEDVALQDRVDTKYIMSISELYAAVQSVERDYRVLCINGRCLSRYQTLYFDTPDFALYRQHHNGTGTRFKVRERRYVESDLTFIEVKQRTNKQRTIKSRLRISAIQTELDNRARAFVGEYLSLQTDELEPKLWNEYVRITLASKVRRERLTLDLNLAFGWDGACSNLRGLAIAEIKQERASRNSDFARAMRRLGIRPGSMSKYCAGVCLLYDHVKVNNFKTRMRQMEKVIEKEIAHERDR